MFCLRIFLTILATLALCPASAQAQGSPSVLWQKTYNSDRINAVVFSPDGNTFITGSSDRLINFWNADDGTLLRTFNQNAAYVHESAVESLAITRDGTKLASASYKVAKIWTISSGSVINLYGHLDWVVGVAFGPGGGVLATASFDQTIKLWRVSDGALLKTLTGHSGQVRCVAFSPDGQYLASGSGDTTIRIWRTSDWATIRILRGHTSDIYDLAWSPDGTKIASGGYDYTARLWNVSDGALLQTFTGNNGWVYSVGFSPDGQTLAFSTGEGNTLKLAHVSDGSVFREFTDNTYNIQAVAFSPRNNSILGYGRADNTIVMSDVYAAPPPPQNTVATPVISPNGGSFTGSVAVTISSTTSGAQIRYTLDGSDPISTSLLYSAAISISNSTTLKARAFASGMADSAVASATFNVSPGMAVATPVINPNGGSFNGSTTVAISCSTTGATIRFTLDGSDPSSAAPLYSAPLTLASNATLKARAFAPGMLDSAVATAAFTILNPTTTATPDISPNGGTFSGSITVRLSDVTPGATIRYSTNGADPTATSPLYTGPLTFTSGTTLKAKAFAPSLLDSAIASATFAPSELAQPTATFVATDVATQGDWKGKYGSEGYNVIASGASLPTNIVVTPSGQSQFIWVQSTYARIALQKPGTATDRIAATWTAPSSFSINLNFTEGKTHRVAFYFLDFDTTNRSEIIDILDAKTGAVLDSKTMTSFNLGKYLLWDLSGNVLVRVTLTAGANAVLSGFFIDPAPARIPRCEGFLTPSGFQLKLSGSIGTRVAVQSSTNLINWFSISTNTFTSTNLFLTDPSLGGSPLKCYRAIALP